MADKRILIVEDTLSLAETYKAYLKPVFAHCDMASTGKAALAALEAAPYDCVVLDINLPDMNGLDIMRQMKASGIPAEVVVITATGSVNLAVDVMRMGAFDFIVKPFNAERLRVTVRNAVDRRAMARTIETIREEMADGAVGSFIGASLPMQAVYRILRNAAPSNATVFVTGESGTGKELCAEALHKLSKRASGPFVTLNCAAIPKDLLESEIFGHVKGAYSGAVSDRNGAALQADGGTLFLDEICEMDLALQAKLLRFLQSRQVQRLGEDRLRNSDVRVVCATNRNPMEEVRAGRFREDLFYRLHVIPVELPPLKERGGDIVEIASAFLKQFAREDGKAFVKFSPAAETALMAYEWPGNVRQLQNVVRNVVVLNDGETVTADMLPLDLLGGVRERATPELQQETSIAAPLHAALAAAKAMDAREGGQPIRPLEDVIRETIEAAIDACDGSIPRAAAALDVSPSTLYRRIESWKTPDAA